MLTTAWCAWLGSIVLSLTVGVHPAHAGPPLQIIAQPANQLATSGVVTGAVARLEATVTFADPNLETAVRDALSIPSDPITPADLLALVELRVSGRGIANLTGLEWATNLAILEANFNAVRDLTPLAGLVNLTEGQFWANALTDASPLRNLTGLHLLNLGSNPVTNALAAVTNMLSLEVLNLAFNPLHDVAPLSGLTNLVSLFLWDARLTDASPLAGLTRLRQLDIGGNAITNTYAAVTNMPGLEWLVLSNHLLYDASPLSALTNLLGLYLWDTRLTDASPLVGLTRLGWLDLGANAITNAVAVVTNMPLLQFLNLNHNLLYDATPLRVLTNLIRLHLWDTHLTDASPLLGFTQLRELNLGYNSITNSLAVVTNMFSLELLSLNDNLLFDATPLSSLTNLTELHLWNSRITNVAPLAGLWRLRTLCVGYNPLYDVSALAALTNLTWASLRQAELTDIGVLGAWPNLSFLDVAANRLDVNEGTPALAIIQSLLDRGAHVDYLPQSLPTITAQPQSQIVAPGGTASFTVSATSTEPLGYQWQRDGTNLADDGRVAGALTGTLTLSSAVESNAGGYRVVVSNAHGAVTSQVATLEVRPPVVATNLVIPFGSTWKYWDRGTDLGTEWSQSGYDDSTWSTGAAELGYGDGDEATVVSYGPEPGNKYITTYFRNEFLLADPAAWTTLDLQLLYDDGGVVYLNGTEVFRVFMPEGPISYTTLADAAVGDNALSATDIGAGVLEAGTNVIAVEIHQGSAGSSDISFDLMLSGLSEGWPPLIASQPQDQLVAPGATTTFSVTATGTAPMAYQWQKDGANLTDDARVSGALTETLTLNSALESDAGGYRVVVTNAYGAVTSQGAVLTVLPPVAFKGEWPGFIRGTPSAVVVTNGLAYVAQGFGGLAILSVTNPAAPVPVGSCDTPGSAYGVAVAGGYAYVADGDGGLHVIDVGNAAQPVLVGGYDTSGWARAVAVAGNYAYVADWVSGLQVIDVSNPAAPVRVGGFDTSGSAVGVAVAGRYAYIADGATGLQIIDVSNVAVPLPVGSCDTAGSAYGVALAGSYAYIADGAAGLQIIDVSNVAVPVPVGGCDTSGWALGVAVAGDYACIADSTAGLQVIDVRNPEAPALASTCDTDGTAQCVAVAGGYAYVADWDGGLQVIDVSTPTAPVPAGGYGEPGYSYSVSVSGSYVYVADDYAGLQVIDVNNPAAPVRVGGCDTAGRALGVTVAGGHAHVADYTGGLQVFDLRNPAAPVLAGGCDTMGSAVVLAVAGGYAYVAMGFDGLQVIDLRDPANPVCVGGCDTSGYAQGVAVADGYVYVADSASGLQVIDVRNPAAPMRVGGYDTSGMARCVAVADGYAYVPAVDAGLQVIDVRNPAAPTWVGGYDTSGSALGVAVADGYAYVADGAAGLQVIDVRNPAAPALRGSYDTRGFAENVAVVGNLAFVADLEWGLVILEIPFAAPQPPAIVSQPISQTVTAGSSAILSVVPSGSLPLSYQWWFNGTTALPNATNATLLLSNVQSAAAGSYTVVVSNGLGSISSELAALRVVCLDPATGHTYEFVPGAFTWPEARQLAETRSCNSLTGHLATITSPAENTFLTQVVPAEATPWIGGFQPSGSPEPAGNWQWVTGEPFNYTAWLSSPAQPDNHRGDDSMCFIMWGWAIGIWTDELGSDRFPCLVEYDPPPESPRLTWQPQSQSVAISNRASFAVAAAGTEPLTYQWQKDGIDLFDGGNIIGAGTASLILSNVQPSDAGGYTVVVTNTLGAVTSQVATLTVFGPPEILLNGLPPSTNSVFLAGPAQIELTSSLTNGWIFFTLDGSDPAQGNVYIGPLTVTASAIVRAAVFTADFTQRAETDPLLITWLAPPTISRHPASQTVSEGSAVLLSVEATGSPAPAYQWFKDSVPLPGQTAAALSLGSAQLLDSGAYWAVASNAAGAATSAVATLSVLAPPGFAMVPSGISVPLGSNVTFTVIAIGSPPLTYQWRKNGVNIPDATNASYTIPNVQVADGGAYSVLVANPVGIALSDPIPLLVEVPATAPPPQDHFVNRAELVGLSGFATGTVVHATREGGEPFHAGKYGTNSVWYHWIAPGNGVAHFQTIGSTFDTLLGVYTGANLTELTIVARDEDQGGALTSELQFNAQEGVEYQIAIDGFAGQQGEFILGWGLEPRVDLLPVITLQPASQTVAPGVMVVLTVAASGEGLTYQWHLNGTPVSGATAATLTLSAVQVKDVGSYVLGITNAAGLGVQTEAAVIEIGSSVDARSQNKVEDIFYAELTGSAPLPAPLGEGRRALPASSQTSGGFTPVTAGTAGYQVMNTTLADTQPGEPPPCGVIGGRSRWFGLEAAEAGLMILDTIGSAYDTVLAVYTGTNSVRTLQTVACDNNGAPDGVRSRVQFVASAGTKYSVAVDGVGGAPGVTVLNWRLGWPAMVQVTSEPQPVLKRGGRLHLSVGVSGANPPAVCQWYRDGELLAGATGTVLELVNVQPEQAGRYWVAVSNLMEVVSCEVATVAVDASMAALVMSTFDANLEGWGVTSAAANARSQDGFATAEDVGADVPWSWVAPAKFLGNQSGAYGGWLQFEVWHSAAAGTALSAATVWLEGSGLSLEYYSSDLPSTVRNLYRIPLEAGSGWVRSDEGRVATDEELKELLGAVSGLRIRGKHRAGSGSGGLDNVAFIVPCTDVVPFLGVSLIENGAAIVLEWPVNAGEFEVQWNGQVTGTEWSTVVPRERGVVGCRNRVTVDLSSACGFYRLARVLDP
ncbi:MAG: immunoglobulin domain-containing protein [Verrucomicrobia bacterium]|nr:immunoglobulin domain-containing protein [Verrucomicrobiota bacterium]